MSDTTTLDDTPGEAPGEGLPELVESEYLGADGTAEDTPLKTRVLLPFLVPLLSIAIVAVLVLNISRVFLSDNKNTALALAIGITLAILIGASLIAAAPRLKTSSLAVILGLVFVGVSLSGLASLGHSLDDGQGGRRRLPVRDGAGGIDGLGRRGAGPLVQRRQEHRQLRRQARRRADRLRRRRRSHARRSRTPSSTASCSARPGAGSRARSNSPRARTRSTAPCRVTRRPA